MDQLYWKSLVYLLASSLFYGECNESPTRIRVSEASASRVSLGHLDLVFQGNAFFHGPEDAEPF